MNKQARAQIERITTRLSLIVSVIESINVPPLTLGEVRALGEVRLPTIENAKEEVEGLRDDEQEKFDNLPEGLQQAERGQAMEEAVGYLEEAADKLEEAAQALRDLLDDEPKPMPDDVTPDDPQVVMQEALHTCAQALEEAQDELGNASGT